MRKSFQFLLLMLSVIGGVFGVVFLLMWWSGGSWQSESPAERKLKELQKVKLLLAKWDNLDVPARQEALPDLAKVWQFSDPDLRWQATLDMAQTGPAALPELTKALKDPDEDVRMYGVWGLGIMGVEAQSAFAAVRECLKDQSPDVRGKAVFAVSRLAARPEDAVAALVPVLGDHDVEVQETASRTLARLGPPAVPELRKAMKNDSLDIRRLTVITLGLIGPDAGDAVPDLLGLLSNTQSGLQDETAEALAGIGKPAVAALESALKQEQDAALRKRAILALAKVGKPAVPVLGKVLKDKDASVRLQAVTALGRIGADGIEPLVSALKDEDAEVRQEVARVLGTLSKSDPGVVAALVSALADPMDLVRGQAIASLQVLHPDAELVLKELTPVLEDKNIEVRLNAIRYVGELGAPAVPRLAALLKDPETKVCQRVMETLEEIRAPAEVLYPALLPLLKDENATARQNAVNILWRCGNKGVPQVLEALKDKNTLVRVAAVRSLHQMNADSKISFPALVEALEDESPAVRLNAASALSRFGTQALPNLSLALKDKDPAVRRYTVLALQELRGSPKAVLPLLVQAQTDDSAQVRAATAEALGSFGPTAVPHLLDALKDKDEVVWKQAVESLKKMKAYPQPVVRALSEATKDENYAVRRGAAYVLSEYGADAVAPLLDALKDKDDRVRFEAADSLGVVGPVADKAIPPLLALALSDPEPKVRKKALTAILCIQGMHRFRDDPVKAVPVLIESLQHKLPQTRWEAAQILGAIGPQAKEAVGGLTKAIQDKDQRVRDAATTALERIRGG